jgi:hypothetical protein
MILVNKKNSILVRTSTISKLWRNWPSLNSGSSINLPKGKLIGTAKIRKILQIFLSSTRKAKSFQKTYLN